VEKLTLNKLPENILASLDLQTAFMASRVVIAAEKFEVFRKLDGKMLSDDVLGKLLNLHPTHAKFFLNALVSLGMLQKEGNLYANSKLATQYFIEESSIYWTRQYSKECVENYKALTFLEKTLTSGKAYRALTGKKKRSYVEEMEKDPQQAEDFTQMLYHHHQKDAKALTDHLNLKSYRNLLDVGGGSGVMSIALAKKHPKLRACVLDIEPVCKTAKKIIEREGLSKRIITLKGDMFAELPQGFDVVMFCDIGRVEKGLLKMARRVLPKTGMVVLVDRFLSEDGTEPLDILIHQFIGSSFTTQSYKEIGDLLKACDFHNIDSQNIYKDVWMITGLKGK
jgi:cyclopropane fatty-acyl-phospholipid synthase-like methyltransferase